MGDVPKQKPIEDAATTARKQELAASQRATRIAARERAQRGALLANNRILLTGGQGVGPAVNAEQRPLRPTQTQSILAPKATTAPPQKRMY